MSFWDRFVQALYFGLAQYLPLGRDAALRILDRAIARGRLSPSDLNDTSLVLLLCLLPAATPHRPAVMSLFISRGLDANPIGLIQLLQAAAPPRLTDLVELGRPSGPQLRAAVLNALLAPNRLGLIETLSLYLGRLFLIDPVSPQLTVRLIAEATQRYVRVPLGTVDYLAWVYRVVRLQTRSSELPLPSGFPPGPRPGWFQALVLPEQRFIENCLRDLPEPAVDLLYLHFYARLTVEQTAGTMQLLRTQGAANAVVRRLENCWDVVL